jgi:hypothetical protein
MASAPSVPGVEILGPLTDEFLQILTPEALAGGNRRRQAARLPARDRERPQWRLESGSHPGRLSGPSRGDHGPGRSQDDHQRAELRREDLHGRLRGLALPDVGSDPRRPDQPARRRARHHLSRVPGGKKYALNEATATLIVRPRGWHLSEKHLKVDGGPPPGCIFDFALYFFHNAKARCTRARPVSLPAEDGAPPRSPPVERRLRARRRSALGVPQGTIKATCLIETLWATFQMDEICTSCATTAPASTAAAGTTSSPTSRNSPRRIRLHRAGPRVRSR